MRIFLSYASEDRAAAREIYKALRQSDFDVWFDEEELRVGERWEPALQRAIATANVMLLLVGSAADSKNFQREEIRSALDRARRDEDFRILPVLVSKSDPASLPPALRQYQWLDLRDVSQWSRQLARLAAV